MVWAGLVIGWTAAHLIISLVGGGSLASRNADAQAPCLPHDGESQLERDQTQCWECLMVKCWLQQVQVW